MPDFDKLLAKACDKIEGPKAKPAASAKADPKKFDTDYKAEIQCTGQDGLHYVLTLPKQRVL